MKLQLKKLSTENKDLEKEVKKYQQEQNEKSGALKAAESATVKLSGE